MKPEKFLRRKGFLSHTVAFQNPIDLVFGQKPQVAPYTPTLLGPEQLQAIQNNITAFPDITQLGNLYEQYMLSAFDAAIPGFSQTLAEGGALTQELMGQISPYLKGEIPQDVQEQVQRSSAYESLMGGFAGSPMSGALTARDLGLTSLQMQQQGAQLLGQAGNAAQRWAGLASGMIMSPSGMMITPQQQAQMDMQNRLYEQATKQFGYNVAAAPDPAAAGISGTIMNLLGAYLGHGMGGGGSITPQYGQVMGSTTGSDWLGNIAQGGASPTTQAGYNFGGVPTAGAATPGVFNQMPTTGTPTIDITNPSPVSLGLSPYTAPQQDTTGLYGVSDFGLSGIWG